MGFEHSFMYYNNYYISEVKIQKYYDFLMRYNFLWRLMVKSDAHYKYYPFYNRNWRFKASVYMRQ